MRSWQKGSAIAISALLAFAVPQLSWALWAKPPMTPVNRLLANVSRYVQQNPKDAHGHYVLARLHSLAFAKGQETWVPHYLNKPLKFAPYDSPLVRRLEKLGEPDEKALRHLSLSVKHYAIATQLKPDEALYWLGFGWMLEQGIPYADRVPAPWLSPPRKVSANAWRKQALKAYRQAFRLSVHQELQAKFLNIGEPASIAVEAGQGILRLAKFLLWWEQKQITHAIEALKKKPRPITPILFPIGEPLPLDALISQRTVRFDLDGDGIVERWRWVTPKAGILVWDADGTGRITSGRQLFGSVTWWMFWRDGYEALRALDDDGDGWLRGKELAGIAVWRDRNGNGVSEKGEVKPVSGYGIVAIAVRAMGRMDGVLFNPKGIQLRDGSFLPTYDWVAEPAHSVSPTASRRTK
jgi:hypothetical protein